MKRTPTSSSPSVAEQDGTAESWQESVFAVPVFGDWIVHAPLHRLTAMCGEGVLSAPAELRDAKGTGKLGQLARGLRRPPRRVPPLRTGPFRPEFLGLIPTRSCNLGCRYCAFGASESAGTTLPEAMALDAVDWMAEMLRSQPGAPLAVDFFGGEPTVAPGVMRAVVDRVHETARARRIPHRIEMATNGYFTPGIRDFLGDTIDFIVVSLDGPAEVHDLHRPLRGGQGSYRIVAKNTAALSSSAAHLTVRASVTRATVGRMAEFAHGFCKAFKPSCLNFEPLRPTPESEAAGFSPPNPWDFARAMHWATRAAAVHGVPCVYASAAVDRVRSAFCPIGKDVPIVCPDGAVHACYMLERDWSEAGLDLRLGHMAAAGERLQVDDASVARVRRLCALAPECRSCFCRWHCAGGCLLNMHGTSRKDGPSDFCVQTRILCACRLLDGLGRPDLADRLAEDREAQEALVLRRSDLLFDRAAAEADGRPPDGSDTGGEPRR